MGSDIENIEKEIAALQAKKQAMLESQKVEKLREVKNLIRQFGFTASELGLKGSAKKTQAEPKYANPANPEQTWAGGKGARPLWVKKHLEMGGNLEDFEIKS